MTEQKTLPVPPVRATDGRRVARRRLTSLKLASDKATRQAPVTFGLDFPRGLVEDSKQLCLDDPAGMLVPLQVTALSRWSDGSLRWGLLDFVAEEVTRGESHWPVSLLKGPSLSLPSTVPPAEETQLSLENGQLILQRGEAKRRQPPALS